MTEKDVGLVAGADLQERIVALVRAFGLHRPDQTPCGQPVGVSEAHALMELARGEPLCQNELADRLRLEKSTVSRLVTHLERRQWLRRERDPRDGRAVLLHLTAEGQRIANQLAQARTMKFRRILDEMPCKEKDAVLHALDVLVRAMNDAVLSEDVRQEEVRHKEAVR